MSDNYLQYSDGAYTSSNSSPGYDDQAFQEALLFTGTIVPENSYTYSWNNSFSGHDQDTFEVGDTLTYTGYVDVFNYDVLESTINAQDIAVSWHDSSSLLHDGPDYLLNSSDGGTNKSNSGTGNKHCLPVY